MYRLYDNFVSGDDNKQPYSFSLERHTPIDNLHTRVENNTFNMASIGNVYILNTPPVESGHFETKFKITYMAEFGPDFTVFFGYDEKTRKGYGIRFYYDLKDSITVDLMKIDISERRCIESVSHKITAPFTEDTYYTFELDIKDNMVSAKIAGYEYQFDIKSPKGKIAIERANFIGELILDYVLFETDEEFRKENIIPCTRVDIPLINGGDIPYTVSWTVDKVNGGYYLTATLDGGTRTRKVDREDRPGQYVAEKDWMVSPYIGFGNKSGLRHMYYIASGKKAFIDPNIYWDCQKTFFGDTELPITNTYPVPKGIIDGCDNMVFGYENLFCTGYTMQEGGCEFHFDLGGNMTYMGEATDGRDIFTLKSPEDKYALNFVPEDCYKREEVIEHIKNNHYFDVDENIDLTFLLKTRKDTGYMKYKTSILNVFETETLYDAEPIITIENGEYGYTSIKAQLIAPKMEIGVYRAELKVFYGEKLYKSYIKTFEVYDKDKDISPSLASGLPFTFSMPNEHKRLMRNAFDLWNPMPSCDLIHYFNCVTDTPEEAQTRKMWTLTKKFKREWFAWISSRTCKNWDISRFTDVIENCDYLFSSIKEEVLDLSQSTLFPMRQDHHAYENFLMREKQRVGFLDQFLKENPEIAKKVKYKAESGKFTFEHYVDLMKICASEWIEYQNAKGLEMIRENNREIKAINPKVKRSIYGPINPYVTPTLTNHSLRVYGNSDWKALSDEVFTGFAVYEDYPYSCAYQTYRGAFGLMTILLHSPDLTVYPEQYGASIGGCIDGAVKFAHAPMGAYTLEGYMNSTHAFEFVFNTSYRLKDGYHYWNTYGFHRGASSILPDLIKDWRHALENKPQKPFRTTAFLAEYSNKEDVFEVYEVNDDRHNCYIMNASESGHGMLFECTREAGIPNGFALKYDALSTLSAEECDLLVLPSMKYAPDYAIEEVRRLYNDGVNLVAVSDVTGLEDIFGVTEDNRRAVVNTVCYGSMSEYVRQNDALILYKPNGAEVIMSSDSGEPLVMMTDRTAIINTAVTNLGGADSVYMGHAKTIHIVGSLIRSAVKNILVELSSPLALGQNVGTTLFETVDGRCVLMCIDYTPFDNMEHSEKEAVVNLSLEGIKSVSSERDIFAGKKMGNVCELRFKIKPHETVFIELHK